MKRSQARRSAFTLIEVLLVIAILVVLGTVSVVGYTRIKQGTDKKTAKLLIDSTADAVRLYQLAMNELPETDTGLTALFQAPDEDDAKEKWVDGGGPFLKDSKIPIDSWQMELKYEKLDDAEGTGPGFRVYSYGPDKAEGTDDDISSYTESSD